MEREAGGVAPRRDEAPRLRVLIDARKLWDGGIGVYTQNLIGGLVEQPGVEVTAVVSSGIRTAARFGRCPWSSRIGVIEDDSHPYSYDELLRFSQRIPFKDFDLYHMPHYILPFGVPIPAVVTVHDLIHIHHPERVYYPLIAKRLMRSSLQRAARVLTVSDATYQELQRFCRRGAEKVRVVPNALDPYFLKACEPADYLNTRFRLHGPYLLSVFSTLKPHKGLRDLLEAFHGLKRASRAAGPALARLLGDLKLVLVGQGVQSPAEIDRLLAHAGAVDDVYLFGVVSKEDLLNLYGGAAALVVPSLAEGFGLPVIEAQAQGTPVIARPVPAVKELLTGHDELCEDFSVGALQRGVQAFLEKYAGGQAARAPRADMRRFDRVEIARAVLQVYREALAPEAGAVREVDKGVVNARGVGA